VTYLKCTLVGIMTALAASVIWIAAMLVLPIAAPFLISRIFGTSGAGGAGAAVTSGSIMFAGLVGFIAGFYWQFRRANKSPRRP
jgi:apolipoprotein N-acyltransferase